MEFEWDEAKHAKTLRDRGIGFDDGARIFAGPVLIWEDARREYGEGIEVGEVGERLARRPVEQGEQAGDDRPFGHEARQNALPSRSPHDHHLCVQGPSRQEALNGKSGTAPVNLGCPRTGGW